MAYWTVSAVKQYADTIIRNHIAVHQAERRANTYARRGIERRLDALSHVQREAMQREAKYLTHESYDMHHTELADRIARLETWRAALGGRTAALLGVVALLAGFIGVVLGHLLYG